MESQQDLQRWLEESDQLQQRRHEEVLAILRGTHDSTGTYKPGLSPRVDKLEERVTTLENQEKNKLSVKQGLTLATIGVVIGKMGDYVFSSILGAK